MRPTSYLICAATITAAFAANTPDAATRARIDHSYGKLPLQFEANQGQQPAQVKFLSRGRDYTVFLTPDGATLSLRKLRPEVNFDKPGLPATELRLEAASDLRLKLEGANPKVTLTGADPLPGRMNYFIGNNPAKWRTDVSTYGKVRYAHVYPGIDLVFYGNQRHLEYDFVLSPGAAPDAIRLAVEGADRTLVDDATGDLVLQTGSQEIRFHKPLVYQPETDSAPRQELSGQFRVTKNHVSFALARYDHARTVVVDPVLAYSTFLGGSDEDLAYAVAIDKQGNAYITGSTCSANFPTTTGSYDPVQPPHGSGTYCNDGVSQTGSDVYVTKLNPSGSALVYSTYLGGSYQDYGRGIAVDSAGDAYVAGGTVSADFPVTNSSFCAPVLVEVGNCGFEEESTCQGGGAPNSLSFGSFITKLNPAGSALLWSTFIGGTGNDNITAMTVDSSGDVYVAANATSSPYYPGLCPGNPEVNFYWPTTSNGWATYPNPTGGGFQTTFHQAFSKVSSDGSTLLYSTLFYSPEGNSGNWDEATSIAVDNSGKAYIGGFGNATGFPTSLNAFQPTCASCANNSQYDGFVIAFDPSQSGAASLVYSTYLGGNGYGNNGQNNCGGDQVYGVSVDSNDNAYVTGSACSADFPTTTGAYQTIDPKPTNCINSSANAFLTKLNSTGTALDYSTFLNGTTCDEAAVGYGVSVNASGDVFVTGTTADSAFPTVNPLFPSSSYGNSAFVTEFNSKGSGLLFSTLLGACYHCAGDIGWGIQADNYGNVYVAGQAYNGSLLPTTTGAFQTTYGGGNDDAFALRIALTQADLSVTNSAPSTVLSGAHLTYTIAVKNGGPNPAKEVKLTDSLPKGTTFVSATPSAGSCKTPTKGATKGTVTCTVPTLANAATFTVSMTVDVKAKSGATVTDTANVSSPVYDPNTANNSATTTTTVN